MSQTEAEESSEPQSMAPAYTWTSWAGRYSCPTGDLVSQMTYAVSGYHSHRYKSSGGSIYGRYASVVSSYWTSNSSHSVASTSFDLFNHRLTYNWFCAVR